MARIVIFGPRTGRYGRSTTKYVSLGFLSLAQRLELLRRHKVRVAQSPTRRRYRAQADEYRFQAETFRDPKTQAQILRLAEIYARKAMQAEKWEIRKRKTMANVDFDKTPFITPNGKKVFGTVDTAVDFLEALGNDKTLKRTLSALPRVPMGFYRDNVIACEGDAAEHLFFVVKGVVRSCKNFQHGVRNIVAFYMPGDLFGWTDLQRSLSIEAATDTEVLFLKRSVLLSIASRENRVASFLLAAATNELGRAQEHILLMSKSAKCRLATFLTDLWVRLGKADYLDVPMSYQDMADHLGLTIETVSRTISDMERSNMVTRVSTRRLLLRNRLAFGHMMN